MISLFLMVSQNVLQNKHQSTWCEAFTFIFVMYGMLMLNTIVHHPWLDFPAEPLPSEVFHQLLRQFLCGDLTGAGYRANFLFDEELDCTDMRINSTSEIKVSFLEFS